MQTDVVHKLVHDERGSGHISRVLHNRDEEIQNQYVRQEHEHASHTGDDSVHDEVFKPSVCHKHCHELTDFSYECIDPLHRIVSDSEGDLENEIQQCYENRECHPFVGHDGVNLVGDCLFVRRFLMRLICFSQCSLDKCVFGIHDGVFGICVKQFLKTFAFLSPRRDDFIPVWKALYDLLDVLVILQVFDSQVSCGISVAQRLVFLKQCLDAVDALLNLSAVVDVNMSCKPRVALCIDFYDSVEQFRYSGPVAAYSRADGHSQEVTQLLGIQLVTFCLKFVIHIESHNNPQVHIDYLCSQVKVPLDVGCVHDIDYDIRHIFDEILADIQFLRTIG